MGIINMGTGSFSASHGTGITPDSWDIEHATDANTILLYHMEDNAANTTIVDSSGNGWNSTASANTSSLYTGSGKFNGGGNYNSIYTAALTTAAAMVALGNAIRANYSVETWFKSSAADWSTVGSWIYAPIMLIGGDYISMGYNKDTDRITCHQNAGKDVNGGAGVGIDTTNYEHLKQTIAHAADEMKLFVNNVQAGSTVTGLHDYGANNPTAFDITYGGNIAFGILDEMRVSNVIRG